MAIDFNARLNIQSIIGANAAIKKFSSDLEKSLNNVKITINTSGIKDIAANINSQLNQASNAGVLKLSRALSDLRKAGGESTKVFQSLSKNLDATATNAERSLSQIQRTIANLFKAISTGNKSRQEKLFESLNKTLSLGPDVRIQREVVSGLTKAVELQTSLLKKEKDKQLKILEDFNKRAQQQELSNKQSLVDRNRQRVLQDRSTFISGIESRGGGSVLSEQDRQIREQSRNEDIRLRNINRASTRLQSYQKLLKETNELNSKLGKSDNIDVQSAKNRLSSLSSFVQSGGSTNKRDKIFNDVYDRGLISSIRETNKLNRSLLDTTLSVDSFGKAAALAFKRYGAFILGSAVIYRGAQALSAATDEAIKFEKAITNIEQVLDVTSVSSGKIAKSIREAAVATGTAGNDIAKGVLTFAQAGQKDIGDLSNVAKLLADIPLSATFGSIDDTVEGLIAIQGQFNKKLGDTADILDLVNQFAADFGVESKDIFDGVRRGGSAFAAAGGSIEDFVSLFSVLREKSRESAESLGVFFKTGLSQLINPKSQALLRELGITATNVFEQINQLSGLFFGPGARFSGNQAIQISAKLVGDRQFNRLLTLLSGVQDPNIQSRIQNALLGTRGSFERSITKRLDDVGVSIQRVKSAFLDFALGLSQDNNIKNTVKTIADLTIALTGTFKILSQLLPLVAIAGTTALAPFVKRIAVSAGKNLGLTNENLTPLQQRQSRIRFGAGLAGAGLFAAGSLLQSESLNTGRKAGNFGFSNAGEALQTGIIGTSIAAGLGFGPVGIAVTGLVFAFKSLLESSDRLRKEGFDALLRDSITPQEKISASVGIGGKQLSSGFLSGLSNILDVSSNTSSLAFKNIFGGNISNEEAFNIALKTRSSGLTKNPLLGDISDSLFEVENLRRQIVDRGEVGNVFVNAVKSLTSQNRSSINTLGSDLSTNKREQLLRQSVINQLSNNPVIQSRGFTKSDITTLVNTVAQVERGLFSFKDVLPKSVSDLRESILTFKNSIIDIKDNLSSVSDKFANANSLLDTITTNLEPTSRIIAPSDTNSLLKIGGFDGLNVFDDQTKLFGDVLRKFINSNRDDITRFAQIFDDAGERGSEAITTFQQFFEEQFGKLKDIPNDEINKAGNQKLSIFSNFSQLLEQFAAETNKTIPEVFKSLGDNVDGFIEFIKKTRPGSDLGDTIAKDVVSKNIDLINKRIQIEKDLNLAIQETNQKIFENEESIRGLFNTLSDRDFENKTFGRTDTVNVLLEQSKQLRSRSLSPFSGGSSNIGSEILNAQNRVQDTQFRTQGLQQSLLSGSDNPIKTFKDLQDSIRDGINAQLDFNKLQSELSNRITDLDKRIGLAAQSTNILREAFSKFKDGIESAGQSVTNFTTKDLAKSFQSFVKFNRGGIEKLNDKEFESLTKLLNSVSNIDLGNGLTGGKILSDINQQLGTSLAAAVRSLISGKSIKEEESNIKNQLESIRKQAEQSSKDELKLRQEQIDLFGIQRQVLEGENQFRTEQINKLSEINLTIQKSLDFTELNKSVQALNSNVDKKFSEYLSGIKNFKVPLEVITTPNNPITKKPKDDRIIGEFISSPSGIKSNQRSIDRNTDRIISNNIGGLPGFVSNALVSSALATVPSTTVSNRFNPDNDFINLRKQSSELLSQITKIKNLNDPERLRLVRERKSVEEQLRTDFSGGQRIRSRIDFNDKVNSNNNNNKTITSTNDQIVKTFQSLGDKLTSLDQLKLINNKLEYVLDISTSVANIQSILEKISQVGNTISKLEVSPIQVNVALTAPDIIKLIGGQLQSSIMQAIGIKLSSIFNNDSETSGKIKSSFGG